MNTTTAVTDPTSRTWGKMRTPGSRIPANYIIRAAQRRRPQDAAAMRWAFNYANITHTELEALGLGLSVIEIREALVNPQADPSLVQRFTREVQHLRSQFEARLDSQDAPLANPFRPGSSLHSGCGPIAKTRVSSTVENALRKASKGAMVEIVGLTRIGKTTPAGRWFLRNLDSAIYCVCPSASAEKDFLRALANACGLAASDGAHTSSDLRGKIEGAFGPGGFTTVILDEGHNVWLRTTSKTPCRLELLRRLHDQWGAGVAILATPQFTDELAAQFAGDTRWAPGQYDGRVLTYRLDDTLSDADLAAVARHHAPDFEAVLIDHLVSFAKSSEGYCGAMVNAITRARDAFEEYPDAPRLNLVTEVCRRQKQGRGVELKAAIALAKANTAPDAKGKVVRFGRRAA